MQEKPCKLFIQYAVPQMIGLLFNSVYLIVDGVFIGNVLGRDAMAAAAVAVPLVEILIALSMAIASGAGIVISSHLAQGRGKEARQTFRTALLCAGGLGLLVMALGNLLIHPLARLLGSTQQIHQEAVTYIRYIVSLSPFLVFSFLLSGLARNDGRPRLAMVSLAVGSVSNILLDYLFMCPLNGGIGGAALATAIGPVISVGILLPHFLGKRGNLYLTRERGSGKTAARILTLGFPSFIMEFTIGIITFVYNIAIVKSGYGDIGLAAYLVMGYLMLIVLTLFLGMAEGLQPVFSFFQGAGEEKRNEDMRKYAAKVFLLLGIVCYGLICLGSRGFYGIFNPEDPALTEFAASQSVPYFCGFFLAGFNILMISFWQSTLQGRRALAVSLSRSLILPPALMLLLPLLFGRETIWLCHSLSECLTACGAWLLLRAGGQKKRR